MAKSISYENMSLEDLQNELNNLMVQSTELSKNKRLVNSFIDRKLSEQRIKILVENMSDSDKAALHQMIGVNNANSISEGNNNG